MPYRELTYDAAVTAARRVLGSALKQTGSQCGQPRYNGPCPLCGGDDRFRVAKGERAVLIQCAHDCAYKDLLEALGLSDPDGPAAPRQETAPAPAPTLNPWLDTVWRSTVPADDTPGARYYIEQRMVWLADRRLPAPVRWLPASVATELNVRRKDWPAPAAGCLVYLLAAPSESDVWALKVEAITEDGAALHFESGGKRPSLSGSLTDGGRRTFRASGDADRGVHLVEGPIDALALVTREALGLCDLAGAAVLGADGIGGFTERACEGTGPVALYPDGARQREEGGRFLPEAEAKATRLAQGLERAGRGRVRIKRQLPGRDLADEVQELVLERQAIQEG